MRQSSRFGWAAAVAAAVVAAGGGSGAVASTPTVQQAKVFAALRDTPSETVPAAVRRFVDSEGGRKAGVDVRNVYRVPAPGGGRWSVLSGQGTVCVVFETHENISSCTDTARAASGGLSAVLITPDAGPSADGSPTSPTTGPAVQVGLAPDGVTAATARDAGGRLATEPTSDQGAYEVPSSPAANSLVLRRAAGQPLRVGSTWNGPLVRRSVPIAHTAWNYRYFFCGAPQWCGVSASMWSSSLPIGVEELVAADNMICGNLVNPNGTWAGTTFCTAVPWNTVTHPYNQSYRTGWTGPAVSGVAAVAAPSLFFN